MVIYAIIGGLLPDAIRILIWSRQKRRGKNPFQDAGLYISLSIQVLLALLAVATPLQCVAVGYAAPDVLVRILGGLAKKQGTKLGAGPEDVPDGIWPRLTSWWSS